MPRTPDEMLSAVSQSLDARTGRSLRSVPEVDAEVEDLLRVAYEQNA
jgi:hypothetical protein